MHDYQADHCMRCYAFINSSQLFYYNNAMNTYLLFNSGANLQIYVYFWEILNLGKHLKITYARA